MNKLELLQRCYGYTSFRPGQETLIDAILSGRDALGIMPTGGGKSICYQIPAMMLPGVTLVISPLISLMQDQVLALKAAGIPAAYLNSSLNYRQMQLVLQNIRLGIYKIIYVAPERLENLDGDYLQVPISFVAVDEAHCISQWGQDFRPSYLKIVHFLEKLPRRPVVGAFTATATAQVREDIVRILNLQDPQTMITGFDRPNLYFEVRDARDKTEQVLWMLSSRQNKSGIIYCATRKAVEELCQRLQDAGYSATRYHAGLEEKERMENQQDFLYDRKTVMVATNAFGMGIDKSNVSYVIHYNMPKSLEAYYQEAGRAGRDGSAAECILLFSPADVETAKYFINTDSENDHMDALQRAEVRQQDLRRLDAMVRYCKTKTCLRTHIIQYFGQDHQALCGNCGNCKGSFQVVDVTREAQMVLSCVKRIQDRLRYSVGPALVVLVLKGSKDKKVLEKHLDQLSTYGLLSKKSTGEIRELVDHLTLGGYLHQETEHMSLLLTQKAGAVLFHGEQVEMKVAKKTLVQRLIKDPGNLSPEGLELYEILRRLRMELAQKSGIPAYVVFSNTTLMDMAQKQPTTMTQFKRVSGVGETKANWYGEDFLKAIREYVKNP